MTQGVADSSSILKLVNKTLELPTLPEVLIKLNQIIAEPESTADDVAKVISTDPAVSTNILRIVNSAYYGLQVRVSSINLAVSIMGFSMTKKVALKAAVFSMFARRKQNKCKHFDPAAFWKHSPSSPMNRPRTARLPSSRGPITVSTKTSGICRQKRSWA